MVAETKRAEVVAQDEKVGELFRSYLERLEYNVEVKREVESTVRWDTNLFIYHVSHDAARAERRYKARRGQNPVGGNSHYWLDAVHQLCTRAPTVPVLVAFPVGADAADKALDSGATDVIEDNVTLKIFARRLEMLEAFSRVSQKLIYSAAEFSPKDLPADTAAQTKGHVLNVPLPALRNERSGRVDASRVADYLGISLKRLADAMQLPYAGVHRTPDAVRLQPAISSIVRTLELADAAFGNREAVRMWLNRPLYELENDSPLDVILAGEAGAVETLLENARSGVPG